jgi:ketosteroid isomerase-like protein
VPSNVEIVSEALDAFNRADRSRLDAMVHPDFEVASPLSDIRGRPYTGVDGAREWGNDVVENFASFVISAGPLEEVAPGRVLAIGSARVRGRASGLDYEQEVGLLVEVRDHRICRLQVCFDPEEAKRLAQRAEPG